MKWKSLSVWAKIGIIVGIVAGFIFIISILAGVWAFFFINSPPSSELIGNASKVVDSFYSNLNDRNYENITSILDEEWYNMQTKEETIEFFELINDKLGKAENYSQIGWKVYNLDITYAKNESEKGLRSDITLVYSVKRTNDSYTETFVIRKFDNNEKYFLRSYKLKPKK